MEHAEYRSILITGASGFVGKRLMRALAHRYPNARITGIGGPGRAGENGVGVNLADEASTKALITQIAPDAVFHLAAQSSVGLASNRTMEVWQSNFLGTANLANSLLPLDKRVLLVFASTAEVYGETFRNGPCTEESPLAPVSSYGRSKLAAEYYLKDLAGENMQVVCLRLFNHIGPGQDSRFVVPSFAQQIAQIEAASGNGVINVGNLSAFRDFTAVEDIIRAYLLVLNDAGCAHYDIFNVGSGQLVSIRQILEQLISFSEASVSIERDPTRFRPVDVERAEGIFEKFKNQFKWAPEISLNDTLHSMLDHARANVSAQNAT